MADGDRDWGFSGRRDEGRPQDEDDRRRAERTREGERRSFDQAGRFNSDEDRYGPGSRGRRWEGAEPRRAEGRWESRYDQDRTGYRSAGREQRFGGYGGQEYGIEAGREAWRGREPERGAAGRNERETWRPAEGAPYGDLELNARNRSVEEYGAPHDYAYHPHEGHELDPEYLSWRNEQLRSHDRDYQEWRRAQQQLYDDDYRRFRDHRRDHFGRTFQEWRSQKIPAGGVPDAGGGSGSEFGREPPQVQAAASGWDGRGAPEDRIARVSEEARQRQDEHAPDEAKGEENR
ncbi:hypothetical protein [Phenylobacterium sp.]|uniref:hypothetical protein n=1 Tax=Phenylobacterium sp. TaxID=1871053 RepID=UPI0026349EBD|nr:hypothetical protein [Phenylobacterium sp.]